MKIQDRSNKSEDINLYNIDLQVTHKEITGRPLKAKQTASRLHCDIKMIMKKYAEVGTQDRCI